MALVRKHRSTVVAAEALDAEGEDSLVADSRTKGANRFRGVRCQVRFDDQEIQLTKAGLKVKAGERVSVIPFE